MRPSKFEPQVLASFDVRLLTEIGLLACGAGNTDASHAIFDGLQRACHNNASALIGLAITHLESGAAETAVILLRQHHSEVKPLSHEYDAILALCLLASGLRSEAERILKVILQASEAGCPAHRLAAALRKNYLTESRVVTLPEELVTTRTSKRVT